MQYTQLNPNIGPLATQVVSAEMLDAIKQADMLVAQASAKAAQIIADAEACYKARYQEGYKEGEAAATQALSEVHLQAVSQTQAYLASVGPSVVELVMSALNRVIGELAPKAVTQHIVSQALKVLGEEHRVMVKVSPLEVETVKAQLAELVAEYPHIGYIEVEGDGQLPQGGGCILETATGRVDASIETQLAALKASVRK